MVLVAVAIVTHLTGQQLYPFLAPSCCLMTEKLRNVVLGDEERMPRCDLRARVYVSVHPGHPFQTTTMTKEKQKLWVVTLPPDPSLADVQIAIVLTILRRIL